MVRANNRVGVVVIDMVGVKASVIVQLVGWPHSTVLNCRDVR